MSLNDIRHIDSAGDIATHNVTVQHGLHPIISRYLVSWEECNRLVRVDLRYRIRGTHVTTEQKTVFLFDVYDLIRSLDEESINDRFYLINKLGGNSLRQERIKKDVDKKASVRSYRPGEVTDALSNFEQCRNQLEAIASVEAKLWLARKAKSFSDFRERYRGAFAS